jgi:hypothetical protein
MTKRIYVDSRHGIGTNDDFIVELPEMIVLGREAVCYVTDLSMSHSWFSIDSSNRSIYIVESENGTNTARHIQLPSQNHDVLTLKPVIANALNAGKTVSGTYTVVYNTSTNTYTISLSAGTFKYYSRNTFKKPALLAEYNGAGGTFFLRIEDNADDLLGLRSQIDFTQVSSLETAYLDIRNKKYLFLHSSTLTGYATSGPHMSCLCRIPVTTQFGEQLWKQHSGLAADFFPCPGVSAATLQFSLKDSYNQPVNLNGGSLSFTLIFTDAPIN